MICRYSDWFDWLAGPQLAALSPVVTSTVPVVAVLAGSGKNYRFLARNNENNANLIVIRNNLRVALETQSVREITTR